MVAGESHRGPGFSTAPVYEDFYGRLFLLVPDADRHVVRGHAADHGFDPARPGFLYSLSLSTLLLAGLLAI